MAPNTSRTPSSKALFEKLGEFLERPAGEIAVGFALLFMGAGLWVLKMPKSDDVFVAGLTLISRAMVGAGIRVLPSRKVDESGPPPEASTQH